jgi:hypothetical protein
MAQIDSGGLLMVRRLASALFVGAALVAAAHLLAPGTASAAPTCSTELGIAHHGIHITHDYVVGADGAGPGHEGAAIPGGPGPGFHFPNGFAPGASFCNDQARSPGIHF